MKIYGWQWLADLCAPPLSLQPTTPHICNAFSEHGNGIGVEDGAAGERHTKKVTS